jgi:hypothetical protein
MLFRVRGAAIRQTSAETPALQAERSNLAWTAYTSLLVYLLPIAAHSTPNRHDMMLSHSPK